MFHKGFSTVKKSHRYYFHFKVEHLSEMSLRKLFSFHCIYHLKKKIKNDISVTFMIQLSHF